MTTLPEPENWRTRPYVVWLGLLIFGAGAVYSAAQTATAVCRGDHIAAIIAGGFTVFTGFFALLSIAAKLRSNVLHGVSDETGTTLKSDHVATWLLAISLAGAVVAAGFFVIFASRGDVEIPFVGSGRDRRRLSLMWLLLIFSAGGLAALIVRGGPGHLRISPHGIENRELLQTRTASWSDITEITDTSPTKPTRHPVSFVVKDSKPIVIQNASAYAPSGAALYWMVRHYWKHPETRAELTDGRALERLRNEQFRPQ